MYTSKCILSVLLVACVVGAKADVLVSWGEGTPEVDFDWIPEWNILTILHGNGLNYKFWVHDGNEEPGTGVIENITVHQDATGDFTLLIQEEHGGPGALHWNAGNLEYAGGTSTVTGVKVAGHIAEQDKAVVLDRLDGSIEVDANIWELTIGEWSSPSPARIQTGSGGARTLTINSPVAGDILLAGDAIWLTIAGDFSGSLEIDGYLAGRLLVAGDVLDTGDNHMRIGWMGGRFQCQRMELSEGRDNWLTFGEASPGYPHWGEIDIDTLAGVMQFLAPSECQITVGEIDAGPEPDPEMAFGGIRLANGCTDSSGIHVGALRQGWIATSAYAGGRLEVVTDVGQESPARVARIVSSCERDPVGWQIVVGGNVWRSANGNPAIDIAEDFAGSITVDGAVSGDISIGGSVEDVITIWESASGEISVGGYVGQTIWVGGLQDPGRIIVGGDVNDLVVAGDLSGSLLIGGDLLNAIAVVGNINGDLSGGHIIVDGSFKEGAQIVVTGQFLGDSEFIAIDYDGWDELDSWETGATVWVDGEDYTGNTPEMRIWEIRPCKGNVNNNNEGLDSEDPNVLWHVVNDPGYDYATEFPGLEGSLDWHGDLDCTGGIDAVDVGALAFFAQDPPCCLDDAECTEYEACRADLNRNGEVELLDLAILLAAYGKYEGDPEYNPDADFDNDGYVGLLDLAFLSGAYGQTCSCFGGGDSGGGGGDDAGGAGVSVAMEAYDTNGFEGDGFAGERDHFVFDLTAEVLDDADDWTVSGVAIRAENGAVFRLAAEPTAVDPLASFVRAPQLGEADEPDAGTFVGGAFSPVSPLYDYEPELINLCWFDRVDSLDGPAAIMRLVIDVSGVSDADTADGFGSVYFSQDGPHGADDIKVADFISATGTRFDVENITGLTGEFFVTGR